MTACKKTIAILLSLCMLVTVMTFSASAETITIWHVPIRLDDAKVTALKDGDPETVMQLELTVSTRDYSGSEVPAEPFDRFDPDAEIVIYEGLYISVSETIAAILESKSGDAFQTAAIAKAKPVAFADGKLTVDVFSMNGEAGAKMIAIQFGDFETANLRNFYFDLPRDLLSLSAGTKFSSETRTSVDVSGLQSRKLELPSLLKRAFRDFATGNFGALLGKAIFILPIAMIVAPIILRSLEKNAQAIYDIYGIDLHPMFTNAAKAVRKILPYLIGQIFGSR